VDRVTAQTQKTAARPAQAVHAEPAIRKVSSNGEFHANSEEEHGYTPAPCCKRVANHAQATKPRAGVGGDAKTSMLEPDRMPLIYHHHPARHAVRQQ
jgi:hypothetical protein